MNYEISKGIPEADLASWLKHAAKKYGTFEDGRVNYTDAEIAPAIMCVLACEEQILLVKRSHGLADGNGYWSIISGFIDEHKPVAEIASQELNEELGLTISPSEIKTAPSHTLRNPQEKRSYIIFPCLLKLNTKPMLVLDREHAEYAWINRDEIEKYHILADLPFVIDTALGLS
jgi:8-oxo-dGTP pyrophosphatase MutT (NUDIX family)